jgi:thiamine pyrophosphate-dependent acetolactate synthase large subunit-like protein
MKGLDSLFKVIVLDSSGYKSISLSQRRLNQFAHGNSYGTELRLPDIAEIAKTIGFQSKVIQRDDETQSALEWLNSQSDSAILVAKVSQIEDALPRLVSKSNSKGVLETPPMYDLYPAI